MYTDKYICVLCIVNLIIHTASSGIFFIPCNLSFAIHNIIRRTNIQHDIQCTYACRVRYNIRRATSNIVYIIYYGI